MALATPYRPPTVVSMPYADDGLDEDAFKRRLGAVLTELRLARGYRRQRDLATALNVGARTVSRWENGKTAPSAWDLRTIRDTLSVDVGTLMDPPDRLDELTLRVSRAAGATLRREMLKRNARRHRADETPS